MDLALGLEVGVGGGAVGELSERADPAVRVVIRSGGQGRLRMDADPLDGERQGWVVVDGHERGRRGSSRTLRELDQLGAKEALVLVPAEVGVEGGLAAIRIAREPGDLGAVDAVGHLHDLDVQVGRDVLQKGATMHFAAHVVEHPRVQGQGDDLAGHLVDDRFTVLDRDDAPVGEVVELLGDHREDEARRLGRLGQQQLPVAQRHAQEVRRVGGVGAGAEHRGSRMGPPHPSVATPSTRTRQRALTRHLRRGTRRLPWRPWRRSRWARLRRSPPVG